jgi:hypothetical protein
MRGHHLCFFQRPVIKQVRRNTRGAEGMTPNRCSGSTTAGVGLANGGRFGLTLCDKGLGGRLMLNDNGLTLTDKGSLTAQPAHAC